MPNNVSVDLMNHDGNYQGEVAGSLINNGRLSVGSMKPYMAFNEKTKAWESYVTIYIGGDPKKPTSYRTQKLQTNATLRRDEWKQLDDAVLEAARQRLVGVDDLVANNLVYNLGNAMGTTVLEWHDVNDGMEASVTMDGVNRGNNDRPRYKHNYLPIPIIHADYEINARQLAASRNLGNPLDTTSAERASARVAEKLEDMLFTNTTYSFGEKDDRTRNTIYSYVNHPDRNTLSFNLGLAWDASEKTAAGIITDVVAMKQACINDRAYGPYMIYIPTGYETILDEDYSADTPGTTIRERILKIENIKGIKVSDRLTAGNVIMVQLRPTTIRLVNGMDLTNVEWEVEGKMITKYKVLTIRVPQLRSDQNGRMGLVHMSA